MAIIQTRYRDIPWEEVSADFKPGQKRKHRAGWESKRGKICRIGPMLPRGAKHRVLACSGPFYPMFTKKGERLMYNGNPCSICGHLAEIGD